MEPWLGIFERKSAAQEDKLESPVSEKAEVIIFGLGRYGSNIGRGLRQQEVAVLGVDFDPEAVASWNRQGHPALFGDAGDPEFLSSLPLADVQWIVAAIPPTANLTTTAQPVYAFVRALREQGYQGKIAVTAHMAGEVPELRKAGADLVLLPFSDAAHHAVDRLLASTEKPPETAASPLEQGGTAS
jgi:Trk K+ transport system NAD-binding subunit